jgi:hypothetical protein
MMTGYIKHVSSKRTVDFATVASGQLQELLIEDRIDNLHWREATLVVRVYSHSLASGAGTISVGAYGQSVSAQDPSVEFIDTSAFYAVTITGSTPTPALLITPPLTNILYPVVRLVARGTRTATGALTATFSVDISAKDA